MGFDSIMNTMIPILIVLAFGGLVYVKVFKPYIEPMIKDFIENRKNKAEEHEAQKIITYD